MAPDAHARDRACTASHAHPRCCTLACACAATPSSLHPRGHVSPRLHSRGCFRTLAWTCTCHSAGGLCAPATRLTRPPAPRVARTRAGRAEPAFPAAFAASGAAAAPRLVGLGPRDGNFLTLPQQQVGPPDTRVPPPTPSSCSWVPSCMPGCPGRAHPNAWVLTCPSLQGLIRWLMSGAQVTAPHTTPCPAPAAKLGGTGGTGPPPSCLTRLVAQSNET